MVVSYPIIENIWSVGTQRKEVKEILGKTTEIPIIRCHGRWLRGFLFGKYEAIKYLGKGNCLERKGKHWKRCSHKYAIPQVII